MTVVYQLTSLTAGGSKAQSVNDIVQSPLDHAQKLLAGVTSHLGGLLVVSMELLFLNAVNKLNLLLLGQLRCILRLFGSSLAAGVLVGSSAVTHDGRRNAQRSAALENRLCISSHC